MFEEIVENSSETLAFMSRKLSVLAEGAVFGAKTRAFGRKLLIFEAKAVLPVEIRRLASQKLRFLQTASGFGAKTRLFWGMIDFAKPKVRHLTESWIFRNDFGRFPKG